MTTEEKLSEIKLKVTELWKLQGLELGKPMTVTRALRVVDYITLVISGDETSISTVTRQ